jgi:hypothetical protein
MLTPDTIQILNDTIEDTESLTLRNKIVSILTSNHISYHQAVINLITLAVSVARSDGLSKEGFVDIAKHIYDNIQFVNNPDSEKGSN